MHSGGHPVPPLLDHHCSPNPRDAKEILSNFAIHKKAITTCRKGKHQGKSAALGFNILYTVHVFPQVGVTSPKSLKLLPSGGKRAIQKVLTDFNYWYSITIGFKLVRSFITTEEEKFKRSIYSTLWFSTKFPCFFQEISIPWHLF